MGIEDLYQSGRYGRACGKKRSGKFAVLRKTIRKRMCTKLKEVKTELKARMHDPVPIVGKRAGISASRALPILWSAVHVGGGEVIHSDLQR